MQGASRFQIVEFFGERIRKPSEAPDSHSHRSNASLGHYLRVNPTQVRTGEDARLSTTNH